MFLNLDRWSLPTFALRQVLLRWNKLSRNWTAATFKRGGDGSDIRPFAGHCKFCHSKATSRNWSPSSGMLVCCFLQAENGAAKVSNKGDRFVSTKGSWVRKKCSFRSCMAAQEEAIIARSCARCQSISWERPGWKPRFAREKARSLPTVGQSIHEETCGSRWRWLFAAFGSTPEEERRKYRKKMEENDQKRKK